MEPPPPPAAAAKARSKEHHSPVSDAKLAPSKSNSNTLCKALIVAILLLAIPLFPSEAPSFITHGVFKELWEILHLLFIGIAVSYGLFCRKSDEFIHPDLVVHSRNDQTDAYLSGISHLSSFFEDGFENIYAPGELDAMHLYDRDKPPFHEGSQVRAFNVNEDSFGGNQAWRSQYLRNESSLVVSNAKYFVGESSDFQHLNLPVRSLRSSIVVDQKTETNCSPKIEAKSNEDGAEVIKVRGDVPMNLEKFDKVSRPSPIPWRSNSTRAGRIEDKNNSKVHVHCRPRSVGEVEFEHIKSRSNMVPMFSSSPELVGSSVEDVENRKGFPISRSKIAPLGAEALFLNSEKNCVLNAEEDRVGKGKHGVESLELGIESSGFGNVLSKGKSVRKTKPKRYTMDKKEQGLNQIDHRPRRTRYQFEADDLVKRASGDEPKNPLQNPTSMFDEFHSEENDSVNDRINVSESEEETRSEIDKHLGEDSRGTNPGIDLELEGSEVDRKAGEFIAKFRAQIQWQKVSSAVG